MNRKRSLGAGVLMLAVVPLLLSCNGTTEPGITAVDLAVTTEPGSAPGTVLLRATLTNTGTTRITAFGFCQTIRFAIWGSEGVVNFSNPCVTPAVACAPVDQTLDPGERYVQEFSYNGITWSREFQNTVAFCEAGSIEPGTYSVRAEVHFQPKGTEAHYTLLSEATTFDWTE